MKDLYEKLGNLLVSTDYFNGQFLEVFLLSVSSCVGRSDNKLYYTTSTLKLKEKLFECGGSTGMCDRNKAIRIGHIVADSNWSGGLYPSNSEWANVCAAALGVLLDFSDDAIELLLRTEYIYIESVFYCLLASVSIEEISSLTESEKSIEIQEDLFVYDDNKYKKCKSGNVIVTKNYLDFLARA